MTLEIFFRDLSFLKKIIDGEIYLAIRKAQALIDRAFILSPDGKMEALDSPEARTERRIKQLQEQEKSY